jgi:glycosyltransferase involved in cell wall biosynthesis
VSLIVLSFNHRANVERIVERLRRTSAEEIIVCEDGSIDGARERWLAQLSRPNDFVLCSNDIHEIRAYNRAIQFARGELVCVLQDDDIPPEDGTWVERAAALMDRHPRVAILGGHHGYALDIDSDVAKPRARWVYGFRDDPRWRHVEEIPTVDPDSGIPFMFAEGVSVGPVFHRREVFLALGGFDLDYALPGEPGTLAEHAICLEAWCRGWQVGLFEPPAFAKYVGGQGTMMYSAAERRQNERDNLQRIRKTYGAHVARIGAQVDALNATLGARHAQGRRTGDAPGVTS